MRTLVACVTAVFVLAACGSDTTGPAEELGPTVAAIDIQPNLGGTPQGGVVQLRIVAVDSANRTITRRLTPTWSSSNPQSIVVDSTGLLTARGQSGAVVRATLIDRGKTFVDSIAVGIAIGL